MQTITKPAKIWPQLVVEVARYTIVTRRCLILRPHNLILWTRTQTRWQLFTLPYVILRYFRGSRSSQCFILPTAPSNFLCWQLFWVITNNVQCLYTRTRHFVRETIGVWHYQTWQGNIHHLAKGTNASTFISNVSDIKFIQQIISLINRQMWAFYQGGWELN